MNILPTHNHLQTITRRFDGILFDLDGTLVDTAPDLMAALNHGLDLAGLQPVILAQIHKLVGQGAQAMVHRALTLQGFRWLENDAEGGAADGKLMPLDDVRGIFTNFLSFYGENISAHSLPFPGVEACLRQLMDGGLKLAVCTNKPEALSVRLLDELDMSKYFSALTGGDSLKVKKPDPGHPLATLERLDVTAARGVIVGDSDNDINAGKAAGLATVAVTFGYTDIPANELGADRLIEHFDDLTAALASLA